MPAEAWGGATKTGLSLGEYVETNPAHLPQLLRLADIGPDDVFLDVGCGEGNLLLSVVQETHCEGIGIEKDPFLYWTAQLRRKALPEPLQSRVRFIRDAAENVDIESLGASVVYLYTVDVCQNPRIIRKLRRLLARGACVITHSIPLPESKFGSPASSWPVEDPWEKPVFWVHEVERAPTRKVLGDLRLDPGSPPAAQFGAALHGAVEAAACVDCLLLLEAISGHCGDAGSAAPSAPNPQLLAGVLLQRATCGRTLLETCAALRSSPARDWIWKHLLVHAFRDTNVALALGSLGGQAVRHGPWYMTWEWEEGYSQEFACPYFENRQTGEMLWSLEEILPPPPDYQEHHRPPPFRWLQLLMARMETVAAAGSAATEQDIKIQKFPKKATNADLIIEGAIPIEELAAQIRREPAAADFSAANDPTSRAHFHCRALAPGGGRGRAPARP
mmetsp:Transcript_102488/g.290237  ORF Transcript_102488/g.290237 Transcript_102488/m.290237 type:complete len:446 (+) Transcript_102488:145-1482(+)